jgi:hypothetical protein
MERHCRKHKGSEVERKQRVREIDVNYTNLHVEICSQ